MAANTNGYKEAIASSRIGAQVYVSLLSIWNLDIFRAFYQPFCIHPDMTIVQALALDYIIALYPLILILITFMLVSLHSRNNAIIVTLWGPFKNILRPFFHHLNIETSLIESFATLYLLSVMKIESVTLDLLSPTTLYHVDGRINDKLYLYLAGDVEYFGTEHLPYAFHNICPTLLLFLYPCSFFQHFLNVIHCNFHGRRTFMDVYQGHYKDGTDNNRDYRFFSGIFFVTRLVLLASFILLNSLYSFLIFGTIITILGFAVAILHPQCSRVHYILDCVILMLLSIFTLLSHWVFHGST